MTFNSFTAHTYARELTFKCWGYFDTTGNSEHQDFSTLWMTDARHFVWNIRDWKDDEDVSFIISFSSRKEKRKAKPLSLLKFLGRGLWQFVYLKVVSVLKEKIDPLFCLFWMSCISGQPTLTPELSSPILTQRKYNEAHKRVCMIRCVQGEVTVCSQKGPSRPQTKRQNNLQRKN